MAEGALRYLICYDVAAAARRARIARILEGFGQRVQYSVFEAVLPRSLFDNLVVQLASLVDPRNDRVAFYALCSSCSGKRRTLGQHVEVLPDAQSVFII